MNIYETALDGAVQSFTGINTTEAAILKRADKLAEWLDQKNLGLIPDYTGYTVSTADGSELSVDSFDGTFYHLSAEGAQNALIHRNFIETLEPFQKTEVVEEPRETPFEQSLRFSADVRGLARDLAVALRDTTPGDEVGDLLVAVMRSEWLKTQKLTAAADAVERQAARLGGHVGRKLMAESEKIRP